MNYLSSKFILINLNNYNNLCLNKSSHTKVRASNKISPHNEEVIFVTIGFY